MKRYKIKRYSLAWCMVGVSKGFVALAALLLLSSNAVEVLVDYFSI